MSSTNTSSKQQANALAEAFGRNVATRLTESTAELPYDITERLRAAREQAVARRRVAPAPAVSPVNLGATSAAWGPGGGMGLWNRVASILPLVVLAAGLVLIHQVQSDSRASEVAEVDSAILTDDLPPAAYTDPGFAHFLRTMGGPAQ